MKHKSVHSFQAVSESKKCWSCISLQPLCVKAVKPKIAISIYALQKLWNIIPLTFLYILHPCKVLSLYDLVLLNRCNCLLSMHFFWKCFTLHAHGWFNKDGTKLMQITTWWGTISEFIHRKTIKLTKLHFLLLKRNVIFLISSRVPSINCICDTLCVGAGPIFSPRRRQSRPMLVAPLVYESSLFSVKVKLCVPCSVNLSVERKTVIHLKTAQSHKGNTICISEK